MQVSSGVRWFARLSLMAVAVYLGASYVIHVGTTPSFQRQKSSKEVPLHQNGDAARFRMLLDSGNVDLRNGDSSAAMSAFQAAEKAIAPLDDEQYDLLKQSRLLLAHRYESSGGGTSAESVYRDIVECGNRQAGALWNAKQFERAIARAKDAEQYADNVQENRTQLLAVARDLMAGSFDSLQRFSEEAEVQQREVEYLKSTGDEYSPAIANSLYTLAQTYYKSKSWHEMEQALVSANEACDHTLSRYSGVSDQSGPNPIYPELFLKNAILHDLVVAYYKEGEIDEALAKADGLYQFASSQEPGYGGQSLPHNQPVPPVEAAKLGFELANEAKNEQAKEIWQDRMRQLGVSVVGKNSAITIINLPTPAATSYQ